MAIDKELIEHYTHGDLLKAIEQSLEKAGKPISSLSVADLAPVDEFHIGGRKATENLLQQLAFNDTDHILDIGCGLGGAARYTAHSLRSRVTGIDLTTEYIETGNRLSEWVGLRQKVTLTQGSALDMPFSNDVFDGGYMLHVGMNIENKAGLFGEVFRVLRPGRLFGIYDIMQVNPGRLSYPVPWASFPENSHLASPEIGQYLRYGL